jgi:acyl dehydratase
MRRSREEAAQTRRTAVKAASRLYRERGIEAVSIGDIMASLGMTVGGFYRHFDSKDALVAEACARAFADSARAQEAAVGSAAHGRPLSALLGSYLSEAHRDTPATGCPVPSLVSGISRQPVPVRRAFTEGVRSTLRRIEKLSPDAEPAARTALLGGMIGALALAAGRGRGEIEHAAARSKPSILDPGSVRASLPSNRDSPPRKSQTQARLTQALRSAHMRPLYLEDFAPGQKYGSGKIRVDAAAIKAFAAAFDPQPFHLDEEAARTSFFGGLSASGWHTAALTMRLLVEGELQPAGGIIGAWAEELKWPRAVRPGDELEVEAEVLEVRPSRSRPGQGFVKCRSTTLNQHREPVQMLVMNLLVEARPTTPSA